MHSDTPLKMGPLRRALVPSRAVFARCSFVALVTVAAIASAEAPAPVPPTRAWLTVGGSLRGQKQESTTDPVEVSGVSPTTVAFSGAHFFAPFIGLNVESRFERYFAVLETPSARIPQTAFDFNLSAAGRWAPTQWLGLELHLGVATTMRPLIQTDPLGSATNWSIGPSVGIAIELTPARAFGAKLYGRADPLGFALGGKSAGTTALSGGLQLSVFSFHVGPVQLGVALFGELVLTQIKRSGAAVDQRSVNFGLGLSARNWVDDAQLAAAKAGAKTRSIRGRVVDEAGKPVASAKVQSDAGLSATTDADGQFVLAELSDAAHQLTVEVDTFAASTQQVGAEDGEPVQIVLHHKTGPGRVRGVVKGKSGPLAGVTVTSGALQVKSDAEGVYALDNVGPGPVSVKFEAAGYTTGEELAQVAPATEATLDVTLTAVELPKAATLRGLIRPKSGTLSSATLRVVELKLRIPVKGDGRFSVEIPSGKYTLIIEARGFVTQTKSVQVSPGDQAIFHAELEPVR